jgi:hypothetical protein
MDDIIEEFKERGIFKARSYYFKANDALDIIQKCRILNKIIFGIDAFIITDRITQIIDYIDYSSSRYEIMDESIYYAKFHIRKNSDAGHWLEAEQFVKDRADRELFFEITHE